jgi:hypothetical protein
VIRPVVEGTPIRVGAPAMPSLTSIAAATHPRTEPPNLGWMTLNNLLRCPTAPGDRTPRHSWSEKTMKFGDMTPLMARAAVPFATGGGASNWRGLQAEGRSFPAGDPTSAHAGAHQNSHHLPAASYALRHPRPTIARRRRQPGHIFTFPVTVLHLPSCTTGR